MSEENKAEFIKLQRDHHGIGRAGKQMREDDVVRCGTAEMPQSAAYYIKHGLGKAASADAFKKTLAADNKAKIEAEKADKAKAAEEAKEKKAAEEAAKKK